MKTPLFLTILISCSLLFTLPPTARATTTNLLYTSPAHTENLAPGSNFNVTVKVANFDPFNGWDIHVGTNASVINPVSFTITSNIFDANASGSGPGTEVAHCVNGSGPTSNCSKDSDPLAGNGIVHSAVAYIGGTVSGSGVLFTITYSVAGPGFSKIAIFADTISNGSLGGVSHTKLPPSTYGIKPIQPDFTIDVNPADLIIPLAVNHDVSGNATIILTSIDNLTGQAVLSAQTTLPSALSPNRIYLPKNGSNSSTITIRASNTTLSTQYIVNITATIGSIPHWQILTVHVTLAPDFEISATPSILKIPATGSGLSVITLDGSQTGFSGAVHLKIDVPVGPVAWLDATDFTISPSQPATTLLNVHVPASDFPFVYKVNITASSKSSTTHAALLIRVVNPKPDFTFQIAAPDFVIQAGQSRAFTVITTSVNYFKGQLFFLASSLSGIREKFTRTSVALEYGNSSASQIEITTDAYMSIGFHSINVTALGTTFLGEPVNHSVVISIKIIQASGATTILGLQPLPYFGSLGILWIIAIGFVLRETRRPKPRRLLS